ncbi:MAG: rRNA maturation RNase YbeY [Planctomycetales bacterium 4484_123]|nr:MAG: rRNA maturation RNase YbeY [Planctomycetales bacterium 4484_123]
MLICNRQRAVRVFRERLCRLVRFVARAEGVPLALVDLAVVGKAEMAGLNRRYLRRSGTTDVLSFDLSEPHRPGLSAQIVVCGEVAAEEARRRGLRPQQELMLYVIHGLLHLMGYDDETTSAAEKMHRREEELLARFTAAKTARR